MPLTAADVRWVANLARLELRDEEVARMSDELRAIIAHVDQLRAVDTAGVEPLAHPLAVDSVFRADEPRASLPVSESLANAPERHGDFFGVPPVLD